MLSPGNRGPRIYITPACLIRLVISVFPWVEDSPDWPAREKTRYMIAMKVTIATMIDNKDHHVEGGRRPEGNGATVHPVCRRIGIIYAVQPDDETGNDKEEEPEDGAEKHEVSPEDIALVYLAEAGDKRRTGESKERAFLPTGILRGLRLSR